jgi:hypothetical protein
MFASSPLPSPHGLAHETIPAERGRYNVTFLRPALRAWDLTWRHTCTYELEGVCPSLLQRVDCRRPRPVWHFRWASDGGFGAMSDTDSAFASMRPQHCRREPAERAKLPLAESGTGRRRYLATHRSIRRRTSLAIAESGRSAMFHARAPVIPRAPPKGTT